MINLDLCYILTFFFIFYFFFFIQSGVGIIAVLKKPTGPEILLQKQFRPPVNGVCIEVPAGLLDPNETLEQCAERELYEETGYIGKAIRSSPVMFNDPGFCNTNLKLITVSVDLNDPRNQDPQPKLEENEFIETFTGKNFFFFFEFLIIIIH